MHFFYLAYLLITIAAPIVRMVLKGLGIGLVSYVGFNLVIDQARDFITARFGEVLPEVQQIAGLAKIDVAISILFSAIATRIVISGVNALNDRRQRLGNVGTMTA